jgi:hypothetical protein
LYLFPIANRCGGAIKNSANEDACSLMGNFALRATTGAMVGETLLLALTGWIIAQCDGLRIPESVRGPI